jgi:hypothetical protein
MIEGVQRVRLMRNAPLPPPSDEGDGDDAGAAG